MKKKKLIILRESILPWSFDSRHNKWKVIDTRNSFEKIVDWHTDKIGWYKYNFTINATRGYLPSYRYVPKPEAQVKHIDDEYEVTQTCIICTFIFTDVSYGLRDIFSRVKTCELTN